VRHVLNEGVRHVLNKGVRHVLNEGVRHVLNKGVRHVLNEGLIHSLKGPASFLQDLINTKQQRKFLRYQRDIQKA
jgi:hypothetical protein